MVLDTVLSLNMTENPLFLYLKRFSLEGYFFLIYSALGYTALTILPTNVLTLLVWPAGGVALAAVIIHGHRMFLPLALASFFVSLSVGFGLAISLGITVGNTLEALAGLYLLKQYARFNVSLRHLRDTMWLIGVALFIPIIGASIGITSLWLGGVLSNEFVIDAWKAWWLGDAVGILVLAPLAFKWLHTTPLVRTPAQYIEMGLVVAAVLFTSLFIFWTPETRVVYYLFIPLTWAVLRTGPRGITLALFATAVVALLGTFAGLGPYAGDGLLGLQLFIGTMSALFLIFSVIIDERTRAEALLGRHVDELEQELHKVSSEDEAKKDFLAILAHELRNPLAAILSSAELLRLQEIHAPDTAALLQTIDERVRSMTTMLDDLLDISRISHKKLTLRKENVSLDSIIDRSVRTAQAAIRSRGHTLSVIKPEHELFIEADPIRLEQILVNLLNNSTKYTNQNGSIELSAKRDGDSVVISVSDNGVGIQSAMLKRIFEPFYQVERGKLPTQGLGVGLPLTKQLVEMHGGTIQVQSDGEGLGSTFTVRLPIPKNMQRPPVVVSRLRGGSVRHVKNTHTILVVDDNEIAAQALSRLLELRGHQTQLAYNGKEALQKARAFNPDIIILDIGLPDMDGYAVARLLKKNKNFSSGLIALTGYGQQQDKERAYEAGFHVHCTKPVGLKEIEAAMRKLPHSTQRQ